MSSTNFFKPTESVNESSKPVEAYIPLQDDDWTSGAYERPRYMQRTQGNCNNYNIIIRTLTACFSGILITLGVVLFIFAVIGRSYSIVPPFCQDCTTSMIVYLAIGIFIIFVGIVGAVSAWQDKKVSSALFSILLIFMALIVLASGGFITVVQSKINSNDNHKLEHAWKDLVQTNPQFICEIQHTLQCSGYLPSQCCINNETISNHNKSIMKPCYLISPDGEKTFDPNTLQPISWPQKYCVLTCETSNIYSATCEIPLHIWLKKLLPPTIGVLFTVGVILVGFAGIAAYRACNTRRSYSYIRYEY